MAESKTKKLKRFRATQHQARIKMIHLAVKLETCLTLSREQEKALRGQIKKLGDKIHLYDRKIKDLQNIIHERR
ncbi:hypothetical protein MPH47_06240 [Psychrobacillus psychrodurans]|uniref:hypothetical protein n=1 Tax=Psychrobacillus psychrodurans TaxID=126157 RepID=UPI001F4E7F60|nr:hypothetical protein [Psychrobacillus psychrodurans]MCK1996830.1 hypothetical protein [Psychrobacillus psychrodurans]